MLGIAAAWIQFDRPTIASTIFTGFASICFGQKTDIHRKVRSSRGSGGCPACFRWISRFTPRLITRSEVHLATCNEWSWPVLSPALAQCSFSKQWSRALCLHCAKARHEPSRHTSIRVARRVHGHRVHRGHTAFQPILFRDFPADMTYRACWHGNRVCAIYPDELVSYEQAISSAKAECLNIDRTRNPIAQHAQAAPIARPHR